MMETMVVKCPWCSAKLKIKVEPGIERKSIPCPICKHTSPFTEFKKSVPIEEEPTHIHVDPGYNSRNLTVGRLVVPTTGASYQLRSGENIIGLKASASTAHFQINTGEKKRMSREHLIIEVKRLPASGYTHYVSLFKERLNKTFINNNQLLWGDTLILQHGDRIKLPDIDLVFEHPDEEATQI